MFLIKKLKLKHVPFSYDQLLDTYKGIPKVLSEIFRLSDRNYKHFQACNKFQVFKLVGLSRIKYTGNGLKLKCYCQTLQAYCCNQNYSHDDNGPNFNGPKRSYLRPIILACGLAVLFVQCSQSMKGNKH